METLVSDCFPPIFSYLSLADLLHLRTVSRRLKQDVDDYLPTVRLLPLYLTTQRTPEEIANYENMCLSYKEKNTYNGIDFTDRLSNGRLCFRRLPFGTSGPGAFEDLTILQNQNHFRRSDFLILNHSSALFNFLPFIRKLCPNIEKLALVIDHCDHYLPEVSKVLEAFPAVNVLLLERTFQDSCRLYFETIDESPPELIEKTKILKLLDIKQNCVKLPAEVYNSILALNRLEELYLFSKRQCHLSMDSRTGTPGCNFLSNLLGRLRVFHVNSEEPFELPVDGEPEEKLKELSCPSDMCFGMGIWKFPKLEKFILLGFFNWRFTFDYSPITRPSLKVLDISNDDHSISLTHTQNLNYFTCLETFLRRSIGFPLTRIENADGEVFIEEYIEPDIVPESLKNWSIKHLQLIKGPKTAEERNRDVRRWSKYFVALETYTFLEPEYSQIQVSDFHNE